MNTDTQMVDVLSVVLKPGQRVKGSKGQRVRGSVTLKTEDVMDD